MKVWPGYLEDCLSFCNRCRLVMFTENTLAIALIYFNVIFSVVYISSYSKLLGLVLYKIYFSLICLVFEVHSCPTEILTCIYNMLFLSKCNSFLLQNSSIVFHFHSHFRYFSCLLITSLFSCQHKTEWYFVTEDRFSQLLQIKK